MVKVDLGHRWSQGNCVKVESYVAKVPELGALAELSDDLILAECHAARKAGKKIVTSELRKRFPNQADNVIRKLTAQSKSSPNATQEKQPKTQIEHSTDLEPAPTSVETIAPGGSSTFTAHVDPIPDRLGKYQIIRSIGSGGMGAVYLAHDTALDR